MDSKNSVKLFRLVLAIGFILLLCGLTFFLLVPAKNVQGVLFIFYSTLMFLSAVAVYFTIILQKGVLLYLALNTFIFAVVAAFIASKEANFAFIKYWPLLVMLFGITLIPSGYVKAKKMRTIYVIPAIMLVFLGGFFLLFSCGVIKIPFKIFFIYMWPVLILLAGLFLIAYYFYSVYNKQRFIEEVEVASPDELETLISGDDEDNE